MGRIVKEVKMGMGRMGGKFSERREWKLSSLLYVNRYDGSKGYLKNNDDRKFLLEYPEDGV